MRRALAVLGAVLCCFLAACAAPGAAPRLHTGGIAGSARVALAAPLPAPAPGPVLRPDTEQPAVEQPAPVLLEVENIRQRPELPNGCEATSLAILLGYYGLEADKLDIAFNYMPTQHFAGGVQIRSGGNPEYAYTGNPAGNGYYCFARPVVMAANSWLQAQNVPLRAQDRTGITEDGLVALLDAGHPVIVWRTIDGAAPRHNTDLAWEFVSTGEVYAPCVNLHVVVLCGYDGENFYFADPLELAASLPRERFMQRFAEMGSRAVALQ